MDPQDRIHDCDWAKVFCIVALFLYFCRNTFEICGINVGHSFMIRLHQLRTIGSKGCEYDWSCLNVTWSKLAFLPSISLLANFPTMRSIKIFFFFREPSYITGSMRPWQPDFKPRRQRGTGALLPQCFCHSTNARTAHAHIFTTLHVSFASRFLLGVSRKIKALW